MRAEAQIHANDTPEAAAPDPSSAPRARLIGGLSALAGLYIALPALLLAVMSVAIVAAFSLVARWLHLLELHLLLTMLGLVAVSALVVVATRLASAVEGVGRQLDAHAEVSEHLDRLLAERPVRGGSVRRSRRG